MEPGVRIDYELNMMGKRPKDPARKWDTLEGARKRDVPSGTSTAQRNSSRSIRRHGQLPTKELDRDDQRVSHIHCHTHIREGEGSMEPRGDFDIERGWRLRMMRAAKPRTVTPRTAAPRAAPPRATAPSTARHRQLDKGKLHMTKEQRTALQQRIDEKLLKPFYALVLAAETAEDAEKLCLETRNLIDRYENIFRVQSLNDPPAKIPPYEPRIRKDAKPWLCKKPNYTPKQGEVVDAYVEKHRAWGHWRTYHRAIYAYQLRPTDDKFLEMKEPSNAR